MLEYPNNTGLDFLFWFALDYWVTKSANHYGLFCISSNQCVQINFQAFSYVFHFDFKDALP